jgi:hypothetical protein
MSLECIWCKKKHDFWNECDDPDGSIEAAEMDGTLSINTFQNRCEPWLLECFGEQIMMDVVERRNRFLEEANELVQAAGMSREEAHQLVDYTWDRPLGDPPQEVGGVMVTLAALCIALELNMHNCGDEELARVWTCIDKIRAKQAAKPKFGPLPGPTV